MAKCKIKTPKRIPYERYLDKCGKFHTKLFHIKPERFKSKEFQEKLANVSWYELFIFFDTTQRSDYVLVVTKAVDKLNLF